MIEIIDLETARRTILCRAVGPDGERYPAALLEGIARRFGARLTPEQAVARVVADVAAEGDAALRRWTSTLDGVELTQFAVDPAALDEALRLLPPRLRQALELCVDRVRRFHQQQPVASWTSATLGGRLGQRVTPIQRVGIYVPGGSAPLPSSLLMSAIPAQVAGVEEIVVCTPPRPAPVMLATAALLGVSRVLQLGGAQAIAALAHGTESVPRVDKIVGAGNIFVSLAKRLVYGRVGIDGQAGPTETVIVADATARPEWLAADLLAQAEHDPLASAILLTPDRALAEAVRAAVTERAPRLARRAILEQSLAQRSGIVVTPDVATAVEAASEFAPEHLCLSVADPERWAPRVRHAGGLFLGERSCEVLGDYAAGPSHVMPTGGTARFASPLSVLDFVKLTSIIALDAETSAVLAVAAREVASAESLDAHAAAAAARAADHRIDAPDSGTGRGAPPFDVTALVRPHVHGLAPYQPIAPFEVLSAQLGRAPEEIIKLDANENPYGALPAVRAALAAMPFIHVYPDPESRALRQALAERCAVPAAQLLVGHGSDELIDLVMRLVLDPGDVVLSCPPTFGMYAFDAGVQGARLEPVARRADFALDLPAIAAAVVRHRPKLLCLASPNNPDGSLVPPAVLERLLALPLLVLLDEAYVEFAPPGTSWIAEVPRRENLIVLRSFSKWAALAGLRVGYGAFPTALLAPAWKIKQPYTVSVAASTAALAALAHHAELEATGARLVVERERLRAVLAAVPFLRPYPSQANFVLCRVVGRSAAELQRALAARGILVRYFNSPGLDDHVRVSVGRPEHTDALREALTALA